LEEILDVKVPFQKFKIDTKNNRFSKVLDFLFDIRFDENVYKVKVEFCPLVS